MSTPGKQQIVIKERGQAKNLFLMEKFPQICPFFAAFPGISPRFGFFLLAPTNFVRVPTNFV